MAGWHHTGSVEQKQNTCPRQPIGEHNMITIIVSTVKVMTYPGSMFAAECSPEMKNNVYLTNNLLWSHYA